ncbi:MAG: hypothetical protein KZQ58_01655 [gamma proteobacterium symbiont of Bathyaustriella thionipta]|nr:hypothetical protein [gamma proteobacterium symbiont of Bathyaustriella thionipta]
MEETMSDALLLSIVELGGYPNFIPLYQKCGYQVASAASQRKAIAWLKKNKPQVIVTEFNYDPMFRDRMSNIESLLATLQRHKLDSRVVLLMETGRQPFLDKVLQRYQVHAVLELPVSEQQMSDILRKLTHE